MKLQYELNKDDFSKVIYGDSVTAETPVVIKYSFSDKCIIEKISNLESYSTFQWKPYTGFKIFDCLSKKEYIETYMSIYTHVGWSYIKRVIRHKVNKKIYRIYTNDGMVEATEDHSLLDYSGKKIKPNEVIIGETRLLKDDSMFFCSCVSVEDSTYTKDNGSFSNQVDAMKFYYHLKNKYKFNKVNVEFFDDMYHVSPNTDEHIAHGTVTKIEQIKNYTDYVYDIETEDGTFQAGIGSIIVKNTDSCMIELKTKTYDKFKKLIELNKDFSHITDDIKEELSNLKTKVIEESFETGKKLAKEITAHLFVDPVELEFEKVYHPFMIFTKKRYIGNYYGSSPHTIDKLEKKGIVLSRRDNPDIVKRVYEEVIDPLLVEGSRGINKSICILKKHLQQLKDNNVDLDELVITKTLAKGYGKLHMKKDNGKEYTCEGCTQCIDGIILGVGDYKNINTPHVALAIKQRKRDAGSAPSVNDRISYVFTKTDNPKAKLFERAEELRLAKEQSLEIDYLYYINNQLKNPICEVLNLIMDSPEKIFEEFTDDMVEKKKPRTKKIKPDENQPSILKWIGKK
jgi:hypothetical protein